MLEQRRQQPAAETLALPRIAHHDRDFRMERGRVDDIARDADELLDTVAHRGYREGHMPVIVDVRHGLDPLGCHLGPAAQHALIGRFERKSAHERLLELAIVMADRSHAQRLTRWQRPGPGQVPWIALEPVRRDIRRTSRQVMVGSHSTVSGFSKATGT